MSEKNFRKCISCGKIANRLDFIKITCEHKTKKIVVQPDNKTFGRSCYICKCELCVNEALKKCKVFKRLRIKNVENLDEKIKAVLN